MSGPLLLLAFSGLPWAPMVEMITSAWIWRAVAPRYDLDVILKAETGPVN